MDFAYKIVYMENGVKKEKEFNDRLDLIEFVALHGIKDEDLVSLVLDGDEIKNGIDGLALYAIRMVNKERETRRAFEEACCQCDEECECDEACDCDEADDSDEELYAEIFNWIMKHDEIETPGELRRRVKGRFDLDEVEFGNLIRRLAKHPYNLDFSDYYDLEDGNC